MFGIPVERKAVERSPHGIVIASRGLSENGISIVFCAAGTRTSLPSTRASPPFGMLSTIVFIVPALDLKPRNARVSDVAPGSASDRAFARQSEGTTSKPVPGKNRDSRLLRVRVAREGRLEDVHLARDVEIRGLRAQAGLERRRAGPRERPRREEQRREGLEQPRHGGGIVQARSTGSGESGPSRSARRPPRGGRPGRAAALRGAPRRG